MPERGVAGAEVVDRNAHAQRLQAQQRAAHLFQVVHQHAFGELELEHRAVGAGLGECALDAFDEADGAELHGRQVHRHRHRRQPGVAPAARLEQRLVQHPVADRQHQAPRFRHRDKGIRRHQAELGVLPADQRLAADERTIGQRQLRLEVQHELLRGDRLREPALHLQLGERRDGHLGLEEAAAGAALGLGVVHRRVGMLDERLGAAAVAREQRDADRRRHRDRRALHLERRADGGEQLVRHLLHAGGRGVAGEQHHELVAAEARDEVAGAQRAGDAACHRLQQRIAGKVAERVVHALEVVEVDEQQRERGAARAGLRHQRLGLLDEGVAVRQAGERIVVREVVDALARLDAVAQVAHDRHAQALALVVQRAHDELHRDAAAVLVVDRGLVGDLGAGGHDRADALALVGGDEVQRGPAAHLVQRVAHQRQQRRVDVGDDTVLVKGDALGAGVHELGEPLLAFAQGQLGAAVARDVGDQHERAHRVAGGADVRQQVDLDVARATGAVGQPALVRRRAALAQDGVDLRLDLLRRGLADDLREGQAEDVLLVAAEHRRVAEVGVAAGEALALEVGDRDRHVVGQQAELLDLGAQRVDLLGRVVDVQAPAPRFASAVAAARQRSSHARALSGRLRSRYAGW